MKIARSDIKAMRRLLIIALVLVAGGLSGLSFDRLSRANIVGGGVSSGTGSCSQSSAWFLRSGTLDTTHHNAYDTLICGLVTDGVWSHLDVIQVYATSSSTPALLNLASSSFSATAHGSPTFTADAGYTGIDSSSTVYIDTGFNPVSASGQYALASAHHSAWSFTNAQATSGGGTAEGMYDGSNAAQISPWTSTNESIAYANDAGGAPYAVASSSSQGSFVMTRLGSGTNSEILYKGGAAGITGGSTATAIPNLDFFVLAQDGSGTAVFGGGFQIAVFTAGSNLTGTQVSSSGGTTGTGLVPRLCTYLTAVHGSC